MDEQWAMSAKSRQRWLFYAYDSLRKTVVAHVFGERIYGDAGASYEPAVTLWRGDMDDGWLAAAWILPEGKAARNQQAIYAANWAA